MALNFPGPYQLRVFYSCESGALPALDHVLQLNLNTEDDPTPGQEFDAIEVNMRAAANRALDVVADEIVALLRPLFYSTETDFSHCELWEIEPDSFDGIFISAYDISLAATGIAVNVAAGQQIFTFRTYEGGLLKLTLMEPAGAAGAQIGYAALSAENQDLVDYFIDDADSPFLARDTSFPLAFLRLSPGQSEATFKARYR